jgi:hypothetical protein
MPALLAQYETFVFLPTVIEPFGRLVAEAWAAGCELVVERACRRRLLDQQNPGGDRDGRRGLLEGGALVSRHLITGGAGFIGSALAHRLVNEGHEVTVLDRFSRGKPTASRRRGIIAGDIRTRRSSTCALAARRDLAPRVRPGHPDVLRGPEGRHRRRAARDHERPRSVRASAVKPDLFLVSSSEVYQNPPAGMFPTDETVPLSVPDVTNPRYSYGGGKIASEIATLAYAQAGAWEPGGDRPAAQHLRAGHGLRARDPGVRDADDRLGPGRAGVPDPGHGQETRSSATSTTASTG